MMIAGGGYFERSKKVEVISPTNNVSCTIPDLPQERRLHSLDNNIVCGGYLAQATRKKRSIDFFGCTEITRDGWISRNTLIHNRAGHNSWVVEDGIILLGGGASSNTSEIAKTDGTNEELFDLRYETT